MYAVKEELLYELRWRKQILILDVIILFGTIILNLISLKIVIKRSWFAYVKATRRNSETNTIMGRAFLRHGQTQVLILQFLAQFILSTTAPFNLIREYHIVCWLFELLYPISKLSNEYACLRKFVG